MCLCCLFFFQRPPYFCNTCDKGRVNSEPTQVHEIRVMVNGIMEMYMINLEHISYVSDDNTNTGVGRARSIANDIKSLELGPSHIKEYFVSGCFDGQYIEGGIEKHLKEELDLADDFDCFWDFDHYLEILYRRIVKEFSWVEKTMKLTNTINREFGRSDKKTQLMIEQNTQNQKDNIRNKSLKGHSKVPKKMILHNDPVLLICFADQIYGTLHEIDRSNFESV